MTIRTKTPGALPKPFLKWAGGKGQLLDALMRRVRDAGPFCHYFEPFVGGGALFFGLYRAGLLDGRAVSLSDNNARLIDAYLGVRDGLDELIELLKRHAAAHSKDYYYAMRANVPETSVARAARIIYLNKTCFNGLFRENSKGEFNVPMGRYTEPIICDEANLRACSRVLQRVEIACRHFREVLDLARPGDFVYFDPPYHPLSATSSFTAYDKSGFGENDQRELAAVFTALTERGVKALLSNSMTPLITGLYAHPHFRIEQVYATRAVNSRADRRGKIAEALIRNYALET